MSDPDRWWYNPQGIVAAMTIGAMILGVFYVRERQLWEDKLAIDSLKARGEAAILESKSELEKLRLRMAAVEKAIWELEHRVSNDPATTR